MVSEMISFVLFLISSVLVVDCNADEYLYDDWYDEESSSIEGMEIEGMEIDTEIPVYVGPSECSSFYSVNVSLDAKCLSLWDGSTSTDSLLKVDMARYIPIHSMCFGISLASINSWYGLWMGEDASLKASVRHPTSSLPVAEFCLDTISTDDVIEESDDDTEGRSPGEILYALIVKLGQMGRSSLRLPGKVFSNMDRSIAGNRRTYLDEIYCMAHMGYAVCSSCFMSDTHSLLDKLFYGKNMCISVCGKYGFYSLFIKPEHSRSSGFAEIWSDDMDKLVQQHLNNIESYHDGWSSLSEIGTAGVPIVVVSGQEICFGLGMHMLNCCSSVCCGIEFNLYSGFTLSNLENKAVAIWDIVPSFLMKNVESCDEFSEKFINKKEAVLPCVKADTMEPSVDPSLVEEDKESSFQKQLSLAEGDEGDVVEDNTEAEQKTEDTIPPSEDVKKDEVHKDIDKLCRLYFIGKVTRNPIVTPWFKMEWKVVCYKAYGWTCSVGLMGEFRVMSFGDRSEHKLKLASNPLSLSDNYVSILENALNCKYQELQGKKFLGRIGLQFAVGYSFG